MCVWWCYGATTNERTKKQQPLVMDYCVYVLGLWFVIFNVVFPQEVSSAFTGSELNQPCRDVTNCGKFGYYCAKNRTCQCLPSAYVPNEAWDKCLGRVGEMCKYDEHCIQGAYCKGNKKCDCKDDFYLNDDDQTCSSSPKNKAYQRFVFPMSCLILTKIVLIIF